MAEPARKLPQHEVYDQDKEQPITRPDLRALEGGGETSERGRGHLKSVDSDKQSSSPEELAAAEQEPATDPSGGAESDSLNFTGGKTKPRKGIRGRISKKRAAIGAGLISLTVGVGVGIFTTLQGPLQFLHLGQFLQRHLSALDTMMDDQQLARVRYRRNLSIGGNKAADIVEAKLNRAGFTSKYSTAGFFEGFVIDPAKVPPEQLRDLGAELRIEGDEILLIENGANFKRRALINDVLDRAGMRKIPARISARLMRIRGGVSFKLLGNVERKKDTTIRNYRDDVLKRFSEYYKNRTPLNIRVAPDDSEELTDEERAARERESGEFGRELEEARTDPSKAADKIKVGSKGANILGFVCAARAVGAQYQTVMHARVVLPLIKFGTAFMSMGSQVMSGRGASFDELGAFNEMLYDKENKSSWASARSIQYEMGQDPTGPDMPDTAKPGRIGKKPAFFDKVDSIPGAKTGCKINNNPVGGLAISLFTGGFVLDAAITALEAIGFNPIGAGFEKLISVAVGQPLDDLPKGALAGNYANYGTKLAANDNFIAAGGRELSDAEAAVVRREVIEEEEAAFARLPFSQKLFDTSNYRSLASQTAMQTSGSIPETVANMIGSLWKLPSSMLAAATGQPVYAQQPYEYGFPDFGFSAEERNNPDYADPYQVEEDAEPRLAELNEKYGKCFATTIDPPTKRIISGQTVNYYAETSENNPNGYTECRIRPGHPEYNDFTLYRFYLIGKVTERATECYGGIEDSCDQVGYGNGAAPGGASGGGEPPSGDVQSLAQQILATANITYPYDSISPNGKTKAVLEALARGEPAPVDCTGNRRGNLTTTNINPNVLKFVLEYGQGQRVGVNALTDKCHTNAASTHYSGNAVDFECGAVPFNIANGDAIAAKYGGKRNSETCAKQSHWHYDF